MTDLEIRTTSRQDIDEIIDLWAQCDLIRPWNNPAQDIEIALKNPSSDILVGLRSDKIVATVMCGFDGHRGWIYYVAVHPDFRGNGYGKTITSAAEDWLRNVGAPKVELMIRDTNHKVRDFYERADYEVEPRIVMAKWLIQPDK